MSVYVDRDRDGTIVAAYARPQRRDQEQVAATDPELDAFRTSVRRQRAAPEPLAAVAGAAPVSRAEFEALKAHFRTLLS